MEFRRKKSVSRPAIPLVEAFTFFHILALFLTLFFGKLDRFKE